MLQVSDVVPVACRAAADAGIRSVCVTNFRLVVTSIPPFQVSRKSMTFYRETLDSVIPLFFSNLMRCRNMGIRVYLLQSTITYCICHALLCLNLISSVLEKKLLITEHTPTCKLNSLTYLIGLQLGLHLCRVCRSSWKSPSLNCVAGISDL